MHRDIKPGNFLIGNKTETDIIYIVDFGLSKRFVDIKTELHIAYKDNESLTGTANYSSINTHLGIIQSRRDDMESLGYLFIYFLKGNLPWNGFNGKNKIDQYEMIKQKKILTTADDLCKGCPKEFKEYICYCRKLKFEERPDYDYLKFLFIKLMKNLSFDNDGMYDWIIIIRGYKELKQYKRKPIGRKDSFGVNIIEMPKCKLVNNFFL